MSLRQLATIVVLLAGLIGSASAASIVADTPTAPWSIYPIYSPGVYGWQFSLASSAAVTSLGVLDVGLDGLADAHTVKIWDSTGTNVLLSAIVPSGTTATLNGVFRWATVTPTLLNAGNYIITGAYAAGTADWLLGQTSNSTAAGVTFGGAIWGATNPTTPMPSANAGFFGPNFQIDTSSVPEPGTLFLVSAGLGLLAFGQFKKTRTR